MDGGGTSTAMPPSIDFHFTVMSDPSILTAVCADGRMSLSTSGREGHHGRIAKTESPFAVKKASMPERPPAGFAAIAAMSYSVLHSLPYSILGRSPSLHWQHLRQGRVP